MKDCCRILINLDRKPKISAFDRVHACMQKT